MILEIEHASLFVPNLLAGRRASNVVRVLSVWNVSFLAITFHGLPFQFLLFLKFILRSLAATDFSQSNTFIGAPDPCQICAMVFIVGRDVEQVHEFIQVLSVIKQF